MVIIGWRLYEDVDMRDSKRSNGLLREMYYMDDLEGRQRVETSSKRC